MPRHDLVWQRGMRQSIKAVRGLMVILVIAAHWMPFFVEHLGRWRGVGEVILNPIFRMGTPGFALVFGTRIGFNLLPRERDAAGALKKQFTYSRRLLTRGILALAAIEMLALFVTGTIPPDWPQLAFYSVLLYYLLATVALPFIVSPLMRVAHPAAVAVLWACVALAVSTLLRVIWTQEETGFVQLLQLGLTAKYGFFEMTWYVLLGLALGVTLENNAEGARVESGALILSAALMIFGIVLSVSTGLQYRWFTNLAHDPAHPMVLFYIGLFVTLLLWGRRADVRLRAGGMAQKVYRILSVFGTLSLSAYVGHVLVIPLANLGTAAGMPRLTAVLLFAIGFVVIFAYRTRKRYIAIFGAE